MNRQSNAAWLLVLLSLLAMASCGGGEVGVVATGVVAEGHDDPARGTDGARTVEPVRAETIPCVPTDGGTDMEVPILRDYLQGARDVADWWVEVDGLALKPIPSDEEYFTGSHWFDASDLEAVESSADAGVDPQRVFISPFAREALGLSDEGALLAIHETRQPGGSAPGTVVHAVAGVFIPVADSWVPIHACGYSPLPQLAAILDDLGTPATLETTTAVLLDLLERPGPSSPLTKDDLAAIRSLIDESDVTPTPRATWEDLDPSDRTVSSAPDRIKSDLHQSMMLLSTPAAWANDDSHMYCVRIELGWGPCAMPFSLAQPDRTAGVPYPIEFLRDNEGDVEIVLLPIDNPDTQRALVVASIPANAFTQNEVSVTLDAAATPSQLDPETASRMVSTIIDN